MNSLLTTFIKSYGLLEAICIPEDCDLPITSGLYKSDSKEFVAIEQSLDDLINSNFPESLNYKKSNIILWLENAVIKVNLKDNEFICLPRNPTMINTFNSLYANTEDKKVYGKTTEVCIFNP